MPLNFSDKRYKGRPLLRLLDAYALAVIGELSSGDESMIAAVVDRVLEPTKDWKATVRRSAGLPEDTDAQIRELWEGQPPGVSPTAFVLAVSDANFEPLIDPV
jgi:hypothetical protein